MSNSVTHGESQADIGYVLPSLGEGAGLGGCFAWVPLAAPVGGLE